MENPSDDTIRANVKQLFTVQERQTITDLINRGKIDFVGAALEIENPERAYWLDKYLILKRPQETPVDSRVQEELRKYNAEGHGIDTPEKAAFWEARLKMEKEGKTLPPLEEALKALDEKEVEEEEVEVLEEKVPVEGEQVNQPKKRGRKKKVVSTENVEEKVEDVSDVEEEGEEIEEIEEMKMEEEVVPAE